VIEAAIRRPKYAPVKRISPQSVVKRSFSSLYGSGSLKNPEDYAELVFTRPKP